MTPTFDFIGMVVADLPATLDFYRRLGLDIPAGAESEPHVEVTLPGGMRLAFDPVSTMHAFNPGWTAPTGSYRISLAFACADPAEVDHWYGELTGAGYRGHLAPFDAFWGQRYAVLLDPDGNGVDLYAALPAAS
jgi:catechol 2,3-dioxygenase-like lactoylglutathione lyase family enzyme